MGGSAVSIKDYPYQVAIVQDGKLKCNGAIIDEYHILTINKCINELNPQFVFKAQFTILVRWVTRPLLMILSALFEMPSAPGAFLDDRRSITSLLPRHLLLWRLTTYCRLPPL
ncbi:hypothetical protein Trydic_g16473 [Trypoxylus dichotomus]